MCSVALCLVWLGPGLCSLTLYLHRKLVFIWVVKSNSVFVFCSLGLDEGGQLLSPAGESLCVRIGRRAPRDAAKLGRGGRYLLGTGPHNFRGSSVAA